MICYSCKLAGATGNMNLHEKCPGGTCCCCQHRPVSVSPVSRDIAEWFEASKEKLRLRASLQTGVDAVDGDCGSVAGVDRVVDASG